MLIRKKKINRLAAIIAGMFFTLNLSAQSDEPVIVNVDNFARAETAFQFDRVLTLVEGGEVNKFVHFRDPTPLDKQTVIRMNRDTYYSAAIVDISKGATLTIPETNGRYVSAMVINEDHFNNKVYHKPGTYKLTMEEFGTPYVMLTFAPLVDDLDPEDVKKVWAIQDGITIKANSSKPYTHPNYDKESYEATYKPLIELSRGMPETKRMFGKEEEVDQVVICLEQHSDGVVYLSMRRSILPLNRIFL